MLDALPNELVLHIFELVLRTNPNATPAPFLSLSKRFYQLVMTASSLWAVIHLDFARNPSSFIHSSLHFDSLPSQANIDRTAIVTGYIASIPLKAKTYVKRSQERPLEITLSFNGEEIWAVNWRVYGTITSHVKSAFERTVGVVSGDKGELMKRWKSFTVIAPGQWQTTLLIALQHAIQSRPMPQLTHLSLMFPTGHFPVSPPMFEDCPVLESLSISAIEYEWPSISPRLYNQLVKLSFIGHSWTMGIHPILSCCPNLQHLVLGERSELEKSLNGEYNSLPKIILPRVKQLDVHDDFHQLLDRVDFPVLQRVTVSDFIAYEMDSTLQSLARHLKTVTHLRFDGIYASTLVWNAVFVDTPVLERLEVDQCSNIETVMKRMPSLINECWWNKKRRFTAE